MPAIIPAIAAELANGVRDALRQGAAVVTGNQGNYIANGEPESIYGKIQQATARQACRRYADDPSKYTGRGAVLVENACRPYLDDIGYGGAPSINLPFRGGQCAAKYIVTYSSPNGTPEGAVGTLLAVGPIRGLRLENQPDGSVRFFLQANSGVVFGGQCFNILNPTGPQDTLLGSYTPVGDERARIVSVSPCAANDCGNPLPDIEYPDPLPPGPRREPFNPSPDIDIDIDVEVNPDLTIEVDFGTGPITIDPFGEEGGGGGGGGGVGDPGTPENTGLGGSADGEAPDGQILTGLRIDFVEPPIGGNEYAPGVYRAVCYIYMGTADGLDHDPAGAMLRSGQFVYAEKDFLTRWSVSANAGYNLRVTPYYRPAEAEE